MEKVKEHEYRPMIFDMYNPKALFITETLKRISKDKDYIISGVLMKADIVTSQGDIYPKKVLQRAYKEYELKRRINEGT